MSQRPDEPTPEEREARIAELRARRKARLRVLAIRSTIGATALAVLGLLLLYWLLQTVAGREVLMAQVVARLPADASLTWERAEGPLAGPLILHDVDFRWGTDIHFAAKRAYLDPDIRPLLGRKLRLDALQLTDAQLNLGRSDEPFELPSWPESLPQVEMPLAIQADTIVVDGLRVTQLGEPVIDISQIRGGLELANGELRAQQLQVQSDRGDFRVHGHYLPVRDYDTDLVVSARLPAPGGRTPATLGLAARGDLARMEVALAGRAPQPLHAQLVFTGREDPVWELMARSEELDLALLLPPGEAAAGEPLAFDFSAGGKGGDARLQGSLRRGELEVSLEPSRVKLQDQVLTVAPLVVNAFDGRAVLNGTADLRDRDNANFRFSVVAAGLRFEPAAETGTAQPVPVELREARLGVAGNLQHWAVAGTAEVERDGQQARLQVDGRGAGETVELRQFRATTPGGELDVTGNIGWSPVLEWDLAARLGNFDPGYFVPGWDGRLSGQLASDGRQLPAPAPGIASPGFEARVNVPGIKGSLRGRPLDGNGRFNLRGNQGQGEVALAVGNSRIDARGSVGDRLDINARFEPLQLDDLLPGASGSVRGTAVIKGPRSAPDIDVDLAGNGLRWNDWSAGSITLQGRLPAQGEGGALALRARALDVGMLLDQVEADTRGSLQNLRINAQVDNEMARLALRGNLSRRGEQWQGMLDGLRIAPAKGAPWQLRQPSSFAVAGQRITLSDTCLGADTGGALCLSADWPRQGLSVRGDALPLALVQPWLPPNAGRRIHLRGELTLDGNLRPAGNTWQGGLKVASLEGGIRLGDNARRELVRYDHFSWDVELNPQKIRSRFGIGFQGDGYVDATVDTGWDPAAPLTGELYLYMSRLYWLELFSPDLVRPQGVLEGHVSLRGTRGTPSLGGDARLSEFTGEFPALGLNLSEGKGSFTAQPDGSARINASVKSGEGTLVVDGGLSWFGDATPLQLHISGRDVLIANTSELRAIAHPDLDFTIIDRTLTLRGSVLVPEADIDLERLDRGTSVSEDVVVLDPVDPEAGPSSPLDMDLAVTLGDKVRMSGFGLKGALAGKMQVRARPGREMTATGGLEVSGRYKAYGQDLTITRGELVWSNHVVSDPRINIRAERVIGDVTAGIHVTGRALAPRADVWSDPAMSQSESLAYLVLGRSLSGASGNQAEQVNAASAALSAGSGLLASQLGARLGFDDAGVSQSRALGGSVVGVGKYLSPRLYVGYGVSLIGAGSVLTLKYLLRRGFDVELESSTVENRGSVNWRREK